MSNFSQFIGGSGSEFKGVDLSSAGATHTMDLSQGNYFDGGELTQDTTLAFSNVPQSAKWTYSAIPSISETHYLSFASSSSVQGIGLSNLSGLFFKPDGTSFYYISDTSERLYSYDLTVPWDITTTTSQRNFYLPNTNFNSDVFFKPDGTKMYIAGRSTGNYNNIYEHNLSAPWDINTASLVNTYGVHPTTNQAYGLFFKSDGTKMYVLGSEQGGQVFQFNLSTAWDTSTASYENKKANISLQDNQPRGLFFTSDGLKMLTTGLGNDEVYSYTLNTAWDVSTASYNNDNLSVGSNPTGIYFKNDGLQMYITEQGFNRIRLYINTFDTASLSLPSSVVDTRLKATSFGNRITYEFTTTNDGTDVSILRQYDSVE